MSTANAVEEAKLLVGAIQVRDAKTTKLYVWRLADLSAESTVTRGRKSAADGRFTVEDWAKKIGWKGPGRSISWLGSLIAEARAWPEELRVEGRTIEQHRDARAAYPDVKKASTWLRSLKGLDNIRDRSRNLSEITGSGPVYEATLKLIRARREIAAVPAKLAGSGILGNEANFPQFRRELSRLKNAVEYLDRYLADETVVDIAQLDDALDRILSGEEIA